MSQESKEKVSFKDTLNLPRTDFPIRSNSKVDDPAMIKRWEEEKLFEKSFYQNEGAPKYILHDGPPYSNGHLHMGHAYNNILKDIVTKSRRMFGHHVPVTPGWDCHGLPIELKVTQENPGILPHELKKACREYAMRWVNIQREERKAMGVLMNWDHQYMTMSFDYESKILKAFGKFVHDGYIERKNKTVPWCPSCQTVLAAAEIEYEERKDPSVYILFPLMQQFTDILFEQLSGKEVSFLLWTTTPWSLPLNRAVMLKPDATYVVLAIKGKHIIVGKSLADSICKIMETDKQIVAEINSDILYKTGARAHHPFIDSLTVPVVLNPNVSMDEGTACVSCAPGCGPEDYEIGIRNNLEIYSPLSIDGKYSAGISPVELEGMPVSDGQIWVIKKLVEVDRLLYKSSIRHSYPHCWRCHGGLIYRATKQWFCDLSKDGLKQKSINAIDSIYMTPEKSNNRFKATLEGRLEWCLSRQRIWGVPIPSFICTQCDYTYITQELITKAAENVAKEGIEYWDRATAKELMPQGYKCPACNSSDFKKEQDILDVWFESGVSHYAVLYDNPELAFPADIYLEGKDQHRAWFQSSLLTSIVLEGEPCMKMIFTHGFTVDEKGRKMSKSLGNVVTPAQMVEKIGTDGMRLWASSIDNAGEAIISDVLTQNVQEVFRKIRNTARFLLSNLYDFDIQKDAVPLEKMRLVDQYALQQLFQVNDEILGKYAAYDFTAIFHALSEYCAVDLSAFYLDIIKDRLYVEKADGYERRSAQTACWYILDTLTRLIAPILSFTAEQISDHYQKNKKSSIHLQEFVTLQHVWEFLAAKAGVSRLTNDVLMIERVNTQPFDQIEVTNYIMQKDQQWQVLKEIRSALLKAIEGLREKGIIKHSLEARVCVFIDNTMPNGDFVRDFFAELQESGQTIENFFEEFMIVSQFKLADNSAGLHESEYKGLFVLVEPAKGTKCPRCWQWRDIKKEHGLCDRCEGIVKATHSW